MRVKPLLSAALLIALPAVVFTGGAFGQATLDMSRVIQWFDATVNQARYASSTYPLPVRPPPQVHTTLTNVVLNTGVPQIVIPAGSIINGCDITFGNAYGQYYLAYTDVSAPNVPTAVTPVGNFSTGITSPGRGLEIQLNSGFSSLTVGVAYRCPGPTAQGISVLYVQNSAQSGVGNPYAVVSVDIY